MTQPNYENLKDLEVSDVCLKEENESIQCAAAKLVLAAERLLQALGDPESNYDAEISEVHSAIGLVAASPADRIDYYKKLVLIRAVASPVARKKQKKKRQPTDVEVFDEARRLAKRGNIMVKARWMTSEGSKFDAYRHGNLIASRSDPKEFLAVVRKLVKTS